MPGKWSGTFTKDGEKTFWNVSMPSTPLVLELTDEHFVRLVLTVADAMAMEQEINVAIAR